MQQQFLQEHSRLRDALGSMGDGGRLEDCQHVGATRILGEGDCVDLALAIYPINSTLDETLNMLGYTSQDDKTDAPFRHFQHVSGAFQLFIIESGDEKWAQFTTTRDYLLHHEPARKQYVAERAAWTNDSARKENYLRAVWLAAQTWWMEFYGFEPVKNLAGELSGLQAPWYISGGWSLNLFLGRVTRLHHDLDVQIAYADQFALRDYLTARGWKFVTPYDKRLELWLPYMRLEPPRHQALAHRDAAFIDFHLSDIQNNVWRYRRDPSIVQTMERMTMKTAGGIPFIAPEIGLLFKSRNTGSIERPKDFSDFENVLPQLDAPQRAWLRWAVLVTDPAHPWLERLD